MYFQLGDEMELKKILCVVLCALCFQLRSWAQEPPPLSVYGKLPEIMSASVSDSGDKVAFLRSDAKGQYVLVKDYKLGTQNGFKVENFKPHSVDFIGDRYVKLVASATENLDHFRDDFEYVFAFIYDTKTEETFQLLEKEKNIVPGTSVSRVIGVLDKTGELLIPAYTFPVANGALNTASIGGLSTVGSSVFRVNPSSGKTRLFEGDRVSQRLQSGGRPKYEHAIDWVVSSRGDIIAREDYDSYTNEYRIFTKRDGKWKKIYENDPSDKRYIGGRRFGVYAMTPKEDAIIFLGLNDASNERSLFKLDFNGEITGPIFEMKNADVAGVWMTDNRHLIGVEYSGNEPKYEFWDKALSVKFETLKGRMDGFTLKISDINNDATRMVLKISGGSETANYYLFNIETEKLSPLGKPYQIAGEYVGFTQSIEYKSSDGTKIPAILTWPAGDEEKNLPAIVLPHGGPASYDTTEFDWLAQYFASRGYLVLQPNFRGSSGFGDKFESAGHGEWGGLMQQDLHDGVRAIISAGWVDPERVCIVGGSYGGYAALMAGGMVPDLFKCVAAIAPVTDLAELMRDTQRDKGSRSYSYEYFKVSIGNLLKFGTKLQQLSPVNYAKTYALPVLLVHGKDDTVVPILQSREMKTRMIRAGKNVELVELDGADHWLSTSEARFSTLEAVAKFVETHIGEAK